MGASGSGQEPFLVRHRFCIQTVAFIALLVLPFLLYAAAEAEMSVLVSLLVGLMAAVMLLVIAVS